MVTHEFNPLLKKMFKNSNSILQKITLILCAKANINAIKKNNIWSHTKLNPPDTFISNQQQQCTKHTQI